MSTDAEILIKAADILRSKSRPYYDKYKRDEYSDSRLVRQEAVDAFNKYKRYTAIATQLDTFALIDKEK